MAFSKEEFEIMVEELLYREPISFDMLLTIAEKSLKNKVRYWCRMDETLRDRGYEEDVMQEIKIKLIKGTVSNFLLKNGVDGPVNNDPEEFRKWMFTVADNAKRDFAEAARKIYFPIKNIDETEWDTIPNPDKYKVSDAELERLEKAFAVVLSEGKNIYKVLTWIAQFVFVICYNLTKIESNEDIIQKFEQKTLFEMYDIVRDLSERIDWISISPVQDLRIRKYLNKPWDETRVYGEVQYNEFFMKTGGEKSGKKSISDWMNRMNEMVRQKEKSNDKKTNCKEEE